MKTRIYTLLAALLLTVASVQAQTATTISVDAYSPIYPKSVVRLNFSHF